MTRFSRSKTWQPDAAGKIHIFSRNFGKEAAILAGFEHVQGEAVIVMDADLQHPTYLLKEFIKGYEEGYDQVIAQRNRKGTALSAHSCHLFITSSSIKRWRLICVMVSETFGC